MTAEQNPLEGWKERFPLPESLSDSQFRLWTLSLSERWRVKLSEEVVSWYLGSDSPELLSDQVDTFLGEFAKATGRGQFNTRLSSKQHGLLLRLAIAEQFYRELSPDSESGV